MTLRKNAPISDHPLTVVDSTEPTPGLHELLLRVQTCGICHTDLHIIEGELAPQKLPLIPGHQIVAKVAATGSEVTRFLQGDRVGVPWLNQTCGACKFCSSGRENLCDQARFTGYHVDGGFADYAVIHEDFAYAFPERFDEVHAAPLLCAGVIGYRSLRLSNIQPGGRLGLFGFGASAHLACQIAVHWGCEVAVFTRSPEHRRLAEKLGASWTGNSDSQPPHQLDSAILFAPVGNLVHSALTMLDKGGTLAINAIHLSPIPELTYTQLYYERTIRSVANSTRQDVNELLQLAAAIPLNVETEVFALTDANRALRLLKESKIQGAGVLVVSE